MRFQRFACTVVLVAVASPLLLGSSCCVLPSAEVQNIAPADAKTLIDQRQGDSNFVILDVRNPEEFATGHIAGAINVCYLCPTFQDEIGRLDKSLTYFVYCGSNHRSPLATSAMKAAGFTHLYNMTGGLIQWKAEGLPVEQ